MPACLSRTLGLPPIIPSKMSPMPDCHYTSDDRNRGTTSSLRRTLSAADMSSKIWKNQGGSIKKIASVEHLQSLVHDENPDQNGFGSGSGAIEEIWSSIQNRGDPMKTEDSRLPRQSDVWGSIIDSKKKEDDDVAPYVHPMVKRTTSSLSEKSLEICTESLGSETGADGFSFCVEIEKKVDENENDVVVVEEGEKEEPGQQENEIVGPIDDHYQEMARGVSVARYTDFMKKGGTVRSRALPPPLPSLAGDGGGSNVQMRSHRENGRLVVEAVSVPSRNCFKAERHDGRLLLTFSDLLNRTNDDEEAEEIEEEEELEEDEELPELEDEDNEEDEEEDVLTDNENEIMVNTGSGREGMRNYVHYKFLWLTRNAAINKLTNEVDRSTQLTVDHNNNNSNNNNRVNKVVATLEVDNATLAKSLSKVGHLNPYVYSWRMPPGFATMENTASLKDIETPSGGGGGGGDVVAVKGNCNQREPTTRSLLLWDTRCIATS